MEAFHVNGLNQIADQDGVAFTYDSAGNLTASPGKAYAYDYANRLTSVTQGGGTASLTYDATARLSTLTKGSANYRFHYDGTDMIERRTTSGTLLTRYIHGPGYDEPIAQLEYSSPTSYMRTFFTVDVRGSITGQTQGAASVATNSYDAYGRPDSGNAGLYQYTGQIWFDELQLYYYKARFYDPTIRRFLNADGMNMYAYVGGDPVNRVDPSGLRRRVVPGSCRATPTGIECSTTTSEHIVLERPYIAPGIEIIGSGMVNGFSFHIQRVSPAGGDSGNEEGNCQADADPVDRWPVPGHGNINPENLSVGQGNGLFGYTRGGGKKFHSGIDITAPEGSSVVAASAGRVVDVGFHRNSGNWVEVWGSSGGNTYQTRYWHLGNVSVSSGQNVAMGDQIGTVGRSGNVPPAAQSHLHFETAVNNESRVDPLSLVGPGC